MLEMNENLHQALKTAAGALHDEHIYGGLTDDGSPLREDESAGKMRAMVRFPAS